MRQKGTEAQPVSPHDSMRSAQTVMHDFWAGVRGQGSFLATEPMARALVDDRALALSMGIPRAAQQQIREGAEWILVRPQGPGNWTVSAVSSTDAFGQKEASAGRRSYLALVRRVQQTQRGNGNGVIPEDVSLLQEQALIIYNQLPPSVQREIDSDGWDPQRALMASTS